MIKFVSMQCNMFYIALDIMANEEKIKHAFEKYYGDGTIVSLGVPVSVPVEVPRIICTSRNGHSRVLVSGNCMQLAVGFDENYCDDAEKCYDYLRERAEVIRACLREMGIAVTMVGVITRAMCETEFRAEQELMKKYFRLETDKPVFDVLGKFTFVEDEKYYVNITLNNLRRPEMISKDIDSMHRPYTISKDIAITLDVNDRYRLNYKGAEEPFSTEDAFEVILAKHKEFFADKAERLLSEGIYDG